MQHALERREMQEFHNSYSLSNVITPRMMKSKGIREAWHVARIREKKNALVGLVGEPDGERPLRSLDVGTRIMLKWISGK
jgi:hypothetical protein